MLICAAGDTHGALDRLYGEILAFERTLGVRFDYVLHVGDFGIWPDPSRIDKATRKHDGAGDFGKWFAERRAVPRETLKLLVPARRSARTPRWVAKMRSAARLTCAATEVLTSVTPTNVTTSNRRQQSGAPGSSNDRS